jgi:hypothetical protein
MRLILYAQSLDGSFTTFGSSSYTLLEAAPRQQEPVSRYPLSSLIQHKGTFYRLKLDDTRAKDTLVRATFEKDTTPTGQLAVALTGTEPLRSGIGPATVTGATGSSIYFNLPDVTSPLPEGRYKLSSGTLGYGVGKGYDWQATFSEGPLFEINAGQTRQIEMGNLALTVHAVNENERYRSDVQERSTYAKGTPIYLTPQINGKAGEVYTRFSTLLAQMNGRIRSPIDVKPHVAIVDSAGKEVASADMEYG